jgi:hypothetical protein
MSLSYHYTFSAPAAATAEQLTEFLKQVETEAQRLGFRPTLVLNATFDSPERRRFARRLTIGFPLEDARLKGAAIPADEAVWEHDPNAGTCHFLPSSGVLLVVTDQEGCETTFGFFRYAEAVKDIHGKVLAETELSGRWHFSQFVDSPDRRFREVVHLFARAGFLESEIDEFNPRPV